jgi:NTP pyrophosphatase (non-canonical NTP hydrolase)
MSDIRIFEVTPDRDKREAAVGGWCCAAFGISEGMSIPQRAIRLLEEAAEVAQAAGVNEHLAHSLLYYVWSRPAGQLGQEIGGVGVTVLALAHAAGLSAEEEEKREVARILSKPLSHFRERNKAKNDIGLTLCDTTSTPRRPRGWCSCGTSDDLGPCVSFEKGSLDEFCVYCNHTFGCHTRANERAHNNREG